MGKATRIAGVSASGGSSSSAPNITGATCAITYQPFFNATEAVFSGLMTLPSNYSQLNVIEVFAVSPAGAQLLVARVQAPFTVGTGNKVAYLGSNEGILQTTSAQTGWSLLFICYDSTYTPVASPYSITGLTIAAVCVGSISAQDASALSASNPDYHAHWQDSSTALHTVVNITVSLSQYPQSVVVWIDRNDGLGPRVEQGTWAVTADGAVLAVGLQSDLAHQDIYPPTAGNAVWTAYVAPYAAINNNWNTTPSAAGAVSATFTVYAPGSPTPTWASGAYIDAITTNNMGDWGWGHLYTTIPLDNPDFFFARWTVQTGSYDTNGNLVPGGDHPVETAFTDDSGPSVTITPGSDQVYISNANMWGIPPYKLADGTLNQNNVFRFKCYVGTRLNGGTIVQQNCWQSVIGNSTPGTNPWLDVVFNLSTGMATIDARNVRAGTKLPSSTVPVGAGLKTDSGTDTVVPQIGQGVNVDISGNITLNLGPGLVFSSNALTQLLGNGLTFNGSNAVQANLGNGLTASGGPITLNLGNGLAMNGGAVQVNAGSGISVAGGAVAANLGNGLTTSLGAITLNLGSGLSMNGSAAQVNLGNGLTTSAGAITLNLGSGLSMSGSTLVANLGNGMTTSGGAITLNLGSGLSMSGSQAVVNAGNGITTLGGMVQVNNGAGIGISGGQVVTNLGNGLTTSGGAITLNLGGGLTMSGSVATVNTGTGLQVSGVQLIIANSGVGPSQISSVNVSQLNAGTMTVSSTLTLNGSGGLVLSGGGGISVITPATVYAQGGFNVMASPTYGYNVGGSLVIDGNRNGNFATLAIGGSTAINAALQFTGSGALFGSGGVQCGGVNPFISGSQYYGANTSFVVNGVTYNVRGGLITTY